MAEVPKRLAAHVDDKLAYIDRNATVVHTGLEVQSLRGDKMTFSFH